MKSAVAVVGRGVAGLSTALTLALNGERVVVTARDSGPACTSWAAGAFWHPFLVDSDSDHAQWSIDTYRWLAKLVSNKAAGVKQRCIEIHLRMHGERPAWSSEVNSYRDLKRDLKAAELLEGFGSGFSYQTFAIEMPKFLQWLETSCREQGVQFRTATLDSLDDLEESRVVNCSGLGAIGLVDDSDVYGVEGTVAVFDGQPTCDRILFCPDMKPHPRYFIPHDEHSVVGGSCVTTGDDEVPVQRIVDDARRTFGECVGQSVSEVRVGVRPARHHVRLESDFSYRKKIVVHNYGHGGAGVTMSWGCAQAVRRILASADRRSQA